MIFVEIEMGDYRTIPINPTLMLYHNHTHSKTLT